MYICNMKADRQIFQHCLWTLILTCLCSISAKAQNHLLQRNDHLNDSLVVRVEGPKGIKLKNVWVFLSYLNDTILPNRQHNGSYIFRNVVGDVIIHAGADGFESVADTANATNRIKVMRLKDRMLQLKAIVVKGKTPAMVYKGDTIVLNPTAVNVNEGDAVRELLEQMPGVDINQNSVKVQGKSIERTYVDGKKIFGNNPMEAIDHVAANDVINIKAYEENNHDEQRKGAKKRRRWVLDFITKSKMINSTDAQFLAGLGATMGRVQGENHRMRHALGGVLNFYSEKLLLNVDLAHNNINVPSNTSRILLQSARNYPNYSENSCAGLHILSSPKVDKSGFDMIEFTYRYGTKKGERTTTIRRDYSPTDAYQWRTYQSRQTANTDDKSHLLDLQTGYTHAGGGRLFVHLTGNFGKSKISDANDMADLTDLSTSRSDLLSRSRKTSNSYGGNAIYEIRLGKWGLEARSDYHHNDQNDDHERVTTIETTATQVSQLTMPASQKGNNFSFGGSVKRNLTLPMLWNAELILGYDYKNFHDNVSRQAWDLTTGEVDEVNTYSYRAKRQEHLPKLSIYGMRGKGMMLAMANMSVGLNSTSLTDLRQLTATRSTYHFDNVVANANIKVQFRKLRMETIFDYKLQSQLPDVMQLRSEITNNNPLFVQTGNPALRPEQKHTLELTHSIHFGRYGHAVSLMVNANFNRNRIVNRTWYYSETTYLRQWDYTIPQNGSLCSYDNINGDKNCMAEITFYNPLRKIGGDLTLYANSLWRYSPFYFNGTRDVSHSSNVKAGFIYKQNIRPHVFINLNVSTSRQNIRTDAAQTSNKILLHQSSLHARFTQVMKYFFADINHKLQYQNFRSQKRHELENLLNMYIGAKVFKNRGEISLTIYDIFNSYRALRLVTTENYSQQTQTINNGRFFTVNFLWTFRKVKSPRLMIGQGTIW